MMSITGIIIEEQKNYLIVDTPQGSIRAATRGVLKKDRARVCVGDRVDCDVTNRDTAEGIILKIHERTTFLNRPPLANLAQVILVCTVKEPPLDLNAADRFLVCVSAYGLAPVLVFNKNDRLSSQEQASLERIIAVYRQCGYPALITSASTGSGVRELIEICAGKVSAMAGLSGVGKSALLQRIFPDRAFRVGEVSGPTGRGTHTTTCVTLLPLPDLPKGGYLADTPGLAFVDLPLMPEEDIACYFPELERQIGRCRFNNCIHENEPGCRVRELVDSGEIAPWRVEHYLAIFKEMRARRKRYQG
ncbi:MAG: ribosome small subunit-dependent GTPase A [Chitinispirillaceae bacterium]|nr:ribosome small subunit-dependent GTPase A [Chitinispirillaceae bacterium]